MAATNNCRLTANFCVKNVPKCSMLSLSMSNKDTKGRMNMIGMKFDDVDGEEPMPVRPARTADFGVGVWKTRAGRKAEVRKDKDCVLRNYDLAGVIHFGNQAVEATWTKNGDFFSGKFHDNDLMGPWVEEAPAVEAPVVEAPAVETPAVEAPAVETPAVETPAVETPAVEAPAVEAPVVEAPVVEAPVVEAPVVGLGVWRTQGGQRVEITRDLGSQYAFNLQGRVDSGIKMESWAADGTPLRDVSEPHLKLVGPWIDWKPAETVTEAPVFGVGVWRARNGAKVHIERTDGKEPFVLIGSIPPDPAGLNCKFSWTINGKFNRDGDHPDDLIEPWPQETPKTREDLRETWEAEANDAIKALTAQLQVADRKTVHREGELASMAVLLRDAVKEGEELKQKAKERTAELLAANQRIAVIEKGLDDIKADRCWFRNLSEEQEQTIESLKNASEEQQGKIKSQQQTIDSQFQAVDQTIGSWRQVVKEKDEKIERLRKTLNREMNSNIEETGRLKKLIAGLEEENVVQGFKLSAAIDERDTEKLKAKLDLDALQAATEQKQNTETLPAIRRLKVLMLICRAVTVLLLAAIPLAGQWISQHGPEWMVDSSGQGVLGPGTLFAAFIAWLGICFVGATIEGEIHRIIQSQETEYLRLRNKIAPERRQDW